MKRRGYSPLTLSHPPPGNLPNISFINRKPEPLGTEFKVVACGKTGILIHLELQRGKAAMREAEFASNLLKTAACTARLIKHTVGCGRRGDAQEPLGVVEDDGNNFILSTDQDEERDTYLGDAWFGSVDAVIAADKQGCNLVCIIKTNHNRFPKKYIEEEMKDWPAGSHLVLHSKIDGVDLVAVGYKYSKRKVVSFLANKRAANLQPGKPYLAKWKDAHGNTVSRFIPRPAMVADYFRDSNKIDAHNQVRQFELRLEKLWVSRCGFFRINTTLIGMVVVDAWKAYRHHINTRHRHYNIPLMKFISILAKDMLNNHLTREAPVPEPAFNINLVGGVVNVPHTNVDPEVPLFERLTQDSIYPIPGEDPELDDAMDEAMPAREVTKGEHGIKKIDEWVSEPIHVTDAMGRVSVRDGKRRKRGLCNYCGRKTSYFCPACSPADKALKFWCCGPDVVDGRDCQYKHDSKWIFEKDSEPAGK